MNGKGMEEKEKKEFIGGHFKLLSLFDMCPFLKKIALFPKSHSLEKSTKIGVCERGSRLWNIPFSRVKLLY
jgi:hypothetical protein